MDDTVGSVSNSDYGGIFQLSFSSFVWDVPFLIEKINQSKFYYLTSPSFYYAGHDWFLNFYKFEKESGAVSRLRLLRSSAFPDEPCTQTYRLSVKHVDGDFYWTSKIRDDFNQNSLFLGRFHELLESSLQRDAAVISIEGIVSIHLMFCSAGDDIFGRDPEKLEPSLKDLLQNRY